MHIYTHGVNLNIQSVCISPKGSAMTRSAKIIWLLLAVFVFTQPYNANAAEKKDVNEVIRLIREAATDKTNPSYVLSYMGLEYGIYVGLKDDRPKHINIVAKTYYGAKDEFKTYTIKDDDLDGVIDRCTYKQGDVIKGTVDKEKESGKDIRRDCQSIYDSAIYFTPREIKKK